MKKMILPLAVALLLSPYAATAAPAVDNRPIKYTNLAPLEISIGGIDEFQDAYIKATGSGNSDVVINTSSPLDLEDIVPIMQDEHSFYPGVVRTETRARVSGNTVILRIGFSDDEEDRRTVKKYAEEWVQANISESDSNREKVEKIFDHVSSYSYSKKDGVWNAGTTSQMLKSGRGTCHAHAGLFQALADASGVKAKHIVGKILSDLHIWNIVEIDGTWLHVDASFASQVAEESRRKYCLKDSYDHDILQYRSWDRERYEEVLYGKAE